MIMEQTDLHHLRLAVGIKPMSKKAPTDIRFFRDHSSIFTVEQKHLNKVLNLDAYQNHEEDAQLLYWLDKGFVLS